MSSSHVYRAFVDQLTEAAVVEAQRQLPAGRYGARDVAPEWVVEYLTGVPEPRRFGVPVVVEWTGAGCEIVALESGIMFSGLGC